MIKTKTRGSLIVISGPSGAGKGSVIQGVLQKYPHYWLSVSATSRPIRGNDIPGVTYYFLSKEEFEAKIEEGYFLEYTNYVGNYYGTPKEFIKQKLDEGTDVILEIEIEGASNIRKMIPDALCIFIMPPSLSELKRRLINRGTDSKEKIMGRFQTAYNEINEVSKYNYVIVNDVLEDAIEKVEAIVQAEKCRVDRIEEIYMNSLEEEMHEFLIDKDFNNEINDI